MPSGEARGAAEATCCILRMEVSSICSLLSSNSEVRGDLVSALGNRTRGHLSRGQPKTMGGRVSKHLILSPRMAAIRRPLLLLTPAPPWNRSSGLGNSHSNMLGLVIPTEDRRPRGCGNSNENKPCTKVCMTKGKSSGGRAFLLPKAVTYGGNHRFLRPRTPSKCCRTIEGHSDGLLSIGEAFLVRSETLPFFSLGSNKSV